jgi:3-phenylpropionate/trans-cinnamate dioxygenase ferredoxin reductase subunit
VKKHVVLVGGGLAGVTTATSLRARGFDGQITVLEGATAPYDRPPLSKEYLLGTSDENSLLLRTPLWYETQEVNLRLSAQALSVNRHDAAVELVDGSRIRADVVVIATGGNASRPPIPGADDDRVITLRTLEDAGRIKARIAQSQSVAVVGGGLIGAEVASTLSQRGLSVTLIEPLTAPMAHVWGHTTATYLHKQHEQFGVERVRGSVQRFRADGHGLSVLTDDGIATTVDFVILATGLQAATSLGDGLNIAPRGGLLVDRDMRTSQPSVLAVGDVAARRLPDGSMSSGGHWDAALRDGDRAAATILGAYPPPDDLPWFWTDRHGRHVETLGRIDESSELIWRGEPGDDPFALIAMRDHRVVGAVTVDEPALARALQRVASRKLTVDGEALADMSLTPRELLVAMSTPGNRAAPTPPPSATTPHLTAGLGAKK